RVPGQGTSAQISRQRCPPHTRSALTNRRPALGVAAVGGAAGFGDVLAGQGGGVGSLLCSIEKGLQGADQVAVSLTLVPPIRVVPGLFASSAHSVSRGAGIGVSSAVESSSRLMRGWSRARAGGSHQVRWPSRVSEAGR